MNDVIGRVFGFEKEVFPNQRALYSKLATEGQSPKALVISCADSRIVPEQIMQADPGDIFVCRNAGNIVPPFGAQNGGTVASVEFAVMALGITEIIVLGHSDCGAMKGLSGDPAKLVSMPSVAGWLRHGAAARQVVDDSYPELDGDDRVRATAQENVAIQVQHLRTHPAVAAGMARGEISLHGWFVDIKAGQVLALDGQSNRFVPLTDEDKPLPVAVPAQRRLLADVDAVDAPAAA
ncbi:carbonic anhydrase [Sphingomonas jinjuensis]|uniref:Carbonic anhydrase n=1 Tax=Sphingomonas jinjuensis TaxID=535907 RepID=A0A840F6Y7_9SPHN|nr:carbonic anhydrase [Sphingomonas jinjuensis]MBB4153690.1 carbonic anhydrase [Sphingomonas jinjuensis]